MRDIDSSAGEAPICRSCSNEENWSRQGTPDMNLWQCNICGTITEWPEIS